MFCMGWRSYWCVLDEILHKIHRALGEDRCGWACERHDRALIRYMDRQPTPPPSGPTITVNPTQTSSTGTTVTFIPAQTSSTWRAS